MVYSESDLVVPPNAVRETAALIESDGTKVQTVRIDGGMGHLDGVLHIGQAAAQITKFLTE